MSNGYVIVHSGAGNYVDENNYKKVCHMACKKSSEILESGGSALCAVEMAISILEDSEHTNAGNFILYSKSPSLLSQYPISVRFRFKSHVE